VSKRRARKRQVNDAAPRIPVPYRLLDELRAGIPVEVQAIGEKFGLVGLDPARPLATRKRKESAETFLAAAGDELQRSGGQLSADELERRRATRIVTPQHPHGEPAHYAVVEAEQLVASHDPQTFQADARYPEGVQERDYTKQPEEQRKVIMGAQQLNPAMVLTDTPSAVDGPPIVTSGQPFVLGGNGRAMMLKRAYAERAQNPEDTEDRRTPIEKQRDDLDAEALRLREAANAAQAAGNKVEAATLRQAKREIESKIERMAGDVAVARIGRMPIVPAWSAPMRDKVLLAAKYGYYDSEGRLATVEAIARKAKSEFSASREHTSKGLKGGADSRYLVIGDGKSGLTVRISSHFLPARASEGETERVGKWSKTPHSLEIVVGDWRFKSIGDYLDRIRSAISEAREENPAGTDYRAELLRKAPEFGLDRAVVAAMAHPVLVRVVDNLASTAPKSQLIAAVRRYNEGMTQALSPRVRAVAEAKVLTPATLEALGELLAGAGDASLRDVLRESPRAVIEILERDGIVTAQNRAQFVAGGRLTDEAKDRIEGMFLGRVVGTGDRLAAAAPAILTKVERATPYLVRVAGVNPGLDEIPHVQQALDILADASAHGMTVGELVRQLQLGPATERDPDAVRFAQAFEQLGQRAIGERFKAWAARAAHDPKQATMFGKPPTRSEAEEQLLAGIRTANPEAWFVHVADYLDADQVARGIKREHGQLPPGQTATVIQGHAFPPKLGHLRREPGGQLRYVVHHKERKQLAAKIDKALAGEGRAVNPKVNKLPKPTEAVRALSLALVHKWKQLKAHQAATNERRIAELERAVAAQGKERMSQAFRLAHGIAKRIGVESPA